MILLLKDLYIANSARNIKNINQQRRISYIPLVYKKYKIDSLRFQESNLYYISKVDEYRKLLERVDIALRKERKIYNDIKKKKDSIIQDSIKKVKDSVKKIDTDLKRIEKKKEEVKEEL